MSVQLTSNILSDVKNFLNIPSDSSEFDSEIGPLILGAIGELTQVGRIRFVAIAEDTTWETIMEINEYLTTKDNAMMLIPPFVMMRVKILFDPPPPSNVKFYDDRTQMLLWRIQALYETTEQFIVEPPIDVIPDESENTPEIIPDETPPEITEPVENETIQEGEVDNEQT